MSNWITQLPEVAALDARRGMVRIPPELDVPFTPRVARLVDTLEFRRLAHVTQLGLVCLVYPGAVHTRFEHALGVFRMALRYLRRLGHDKRFTAVVDRHDAEVLLAAALLHDLGHWPFCHPIEDIRLAAVPRHEVQARRFLSEGDELARALREDWGIATDEVLALLSPGPKGDPQSPTPDPRPRVPERVKLLRSILSGPVDVDKMDYLQRDSLHAGVPYGRHFDERRLIGSLVVNAAGNGLAISEKGKTAAEMMVFARYVMFSEVYWHHAVRSATAMLARAFYELHEDLDLPRLFRQTESEMIATLRAAAVRDDQGGEGAGGVVELLDGVFGPRRLLYKRVAEYSIFQKTELYTCLARRPYPWLVRCAVNLAGMLKDDGHSREGAGTPASGVRPTDLVIDAPPVEREVELNIEIFFPKEATYRPLAEVSPVVQTLAQRQFDDYVKRVRVFCHPRLADALRRRDDFSRLLDRAVAVTDATGKR
jgi:HD superfamily phosphohydrolase